MACVAGTGIPGADDDQNLEEKFVWLGPLGKEYVEGLFTLEFSSVS